MAGFGVGDAPFPFLSGMIDGGGIARRAGEVSPRGGSLRGGGGIVSDAVAEGLLPVSAVLGLFGIGVVDEPEDFAWQVDAVGAVRSRDTSLSESRARGVGVSARGAALPFL